nr:unnamed protein product [Spirometra erinaceieuropaei]
MLGRCLKNYCQFDGKYYQQVKGTPMGSPISGLLAELVLQRLEEVVIQAIKLKIWLRYVDDTFVVIKNCEVERLHQSLNGVFSAIQFTREEATGDILPFLDVSVQRLTDGNLATSVHRKDSSAENILNYGNEDQITKAVHGLKNFTYEQRLTALNLYPLHYRQDRGVSTVCAKCTQLGADGEPLNPKSGNMNDNPRWSRLFEIKFSFFRHPVNNTFRNRITLKAHKHSHTALTLLRRIHCMIRSHRKVCRRLKTHSAHPIRATTYLQIEPHRRVGKAALVVALRDLRLPFPLFNVSVASRSFHQHTAHHNFDTPCCVQLRKYQMHHFDDGNEVFTETSIQIHFGP